MLIRLKSSSLVLVVIGSIPMPVYNRFDEGLANNGKIAIFTGIPLWCPRVQVSLNLENQDLDRQNLCSILKIHAQLLHIYLNWFLRNLLLKCVSQLKTAKKSIKPSILAFEVSKVIEFGANREPVYDFLLVINSNLGPISSHRYWDTATYRPTIANCPPPLI